MNTVVIIQARLTSSRLPGKVLMEIGGKPILQHCVEHCRESGHDVVVAIPETPANDGLAVWLRDRQYGFVRGPEDDVLGRYAVAADAYAADWCFRVTADCPFVTIPVHLLPGVSRQGYCSNVDEGAASGRDVELFGTELLWMADREATSAFDREHVTPWMRRYVGLPENPPRPAVKLSVDTQEDLDRLRAWYDAGVIR